MTLTAPLTVLMAFVSSAILSRPKLAELELDPKERQIAELKTRLRICEGARDAARADRDQSDGQLRMVLRRFAEEQAARLQLQRDLVEAQARLEMLRSNAKRSQAPQHLPPPPPLYPLPVPAPLTSAEAQRLGAEALERLMQFRVGPLMSELEPAVQLPLIPMRPPAPLTVDLQRAMQQMDAFICNCAPGRHELFNINEGDVEGDDTL